MMRFYARGKTLVRKEEASHSFLIQQDVGPSKAL
jgi:hypothetical protein